MKNKRKKQDDRLLKQLSRIERTADFERQHVANDLSSRPSPYTEPRWP